ncbi:hypothetical protein OQA88_2113 [Cercophora sp. LCS_1]
MLDSIDPAAVVLISWLFVGCTEFKLPPPSRQPQLYIRFCISNVVCVDLNFKSITLPSTINIMGSAPELQYQHFVPQFLLRNFSHPYKPTGPRKRSKGKGSDVVRPGDTVVRSIDLTLDDPVICEKPIKRILGQMNMYDDKTKPSLKEQRELEELFGKFENQAARIFSKITKAHAEHEEKRRTGKCGYDTRGGVCLTRAERDCVRKFLFILFYRNSTHHRRFNHDDASKYNSSDKEFVREHMQEKGYERPLNVWFDNLKAIIEVDMDLEGKWQKELPKRMYPDDAMWFINHTETYFMSICTPAKHEEEFILTDNSYGVFEGPNTFTRNKETGEVEGSAYCPLHTFAPVSPKLMIILRCNYLPSPLEDADEEVRKWREKARKMALDNIFSEELLSKRLLKDLPVAKARNNYSQIVDDRLVFLPGHDGTRKKDHRFVFDIFPINSWHVNSINGILFDNLARSTHVVFKTIPALARTLEWYLAAPCHVAGKIIIDMDDGREECLRKLEVISRSLGSTKKTITGKLSVPTEDPAHDALRKQFTANRFMWKKLAVDEDEDVREFVKRMEKPESGFLLSYTALGGSRETADEDMDQAKRMWKLRVDIDKWSAACGVDGATRQRSRELVEAAYRNLAPRRFLVYAKFWRAMAIQHFARIDPRRRGTSPPRLTLFGPEDTIAQLNRVVRPECLNQLFYNVVTIDVENRKYGSVWPDIWEPINPRGHTMFLKTMVVTNIINELGFIRDSGIKEIEDLAREAQVDILKRDLHNQESEGLEVTVFDLLGEGERIEILTRMMVRERFTAALKAKIRTGPLKRFKEVFFEYAYPTPPIGWR